MIVVIIAGGAGTRLWPLSTPEHPKHLLKVNDDDKSILQKTFDRASSLTDKIYIVSEQSHIDEVKKQLSELSEDKFLIEPARRGTANCIIAAMAKLSKDNDPNEPVAFIHADHFIRDVKGFVHSFNVATISSAVTVPERSLYEPRSTQSKLAGTTNRSSTFSISA